jgi:hypothetical protein
LLSDNQLGQIVHVKPGVEELNVEKLTVKNITDLKSSLNVWKFTKMFEIDEMIIQLETLSKEYNSTGDRINSSQANIQRLKEVLIGRGARLTAPTNWKFLLKVLLSINDNTLETDTSSVSTSAEKGYYEMNKVLSLIVGLLKLQELSQKNDLKDEISNFIELFFKNDDFKIIYNKIIYSFKGKNLARSLFNITNDEKYETFTQTRIAEWSNNNPEMRIPSKVELAVNSLKEFVDSCLYIHQKFPKLVKIVTNKGGTKRHINGEENTDSLHPMKKNKRHNKLNETSNQIIKNYKQNNILGGNNILIEDYQNKIDEFLLNENYNNSGDNIHKYFERILIAIEGLDYISQTPLLEQLDGKTSGDDMNIDKSSDYVVCNEEMDIEENNLIKQIIKANIFQVFYSIIVRESANSGKIDFSDNLISMKKIYEQYTDEKDDNNFNKKLLSTIRINMGFYHVYIPAHLTKLGLIERNQLKIDDIFIKNFKKSHGNKYDWLNSMLEYDRLLFIKEYFNSYFEYKKLSAQAAQEEVSDISLNNFISVIVEIIKQENSIFSRERMSGDMVLRKQSLLTDLLTTYKSGGKKTKKKRHGEKRSRKRNKEKRKNQSKREKKKKSKKRCV